MERFDVMKRKHNYIELTIPKMLTILAIFSLLARAAAVIVRHAAAP